MAEHDGEMDALVRRLLEATTPRPSSTLMRRIEWSMRNVGSPVRLATRTAPRAHRWWRPALAAAALAIALLAGAVLYPASRAALAAVPGVGPIVNVLGGSQDSPGAALGSATSDGYTVTATGGYDDGTTVVLEYNVRAAAASSAPITDGSVMYSTLTDSSGQPLTDIFLPVKGGLDTHTGEYQRQIDGSGAGTPVRVHISQIFRLGNFSKGGPVPASTDPTASGPDVEPLLAGNWNFTVTIKPTSVTRQVPAPGGGTLGNGAVEFFPVRYNDAYLSLSYLLSGDACASVTGKGCLARITLFGPDGRQLPMLDESTATSTTGPSAGTPFQTTDFQLESSPGVYTVEISAAGSSVRTTFAVPIGRSGQIPKITEVG